MERIAGQETKWVLEFTWREPTPSGVCILENPLPLFGADQKVGVIDIIPKTNFPDIRKACTIRSASSGSLLIEPREGRLVRFYVHLENVAANQGSSFDKSTCSPEKIASIARNIMFPYELEYSVLEWWSAYHVKQQVANSLGASNRVFIAGDAVRKYELLKHFAFPITTQSKQCQIYILQKPDKE